MTPFAKASGCPPIRVNPNPNPRQQVLRLLGKYLPYHAVRLARAAPVGGKAAAPVIGLSIEIVEIGEVAGGEKGAADVADAALDAAFLVAAGDSDGTRFVTIVPGKAQQPGMEADCVAPAFQHGAFQVVVE